ncbi:hypothetical protein V6N11_038467 [Hibiscus sabdariffa]|uniref:CCHC-type domain-containing protein n=1 Tax=Hibiscus sabdariffa TaxID=183260 RepID=A0ABR2SK19_9ROSI
MANPINTISRSSSSRSLVSMEPHPNLSIKSLIRSPPKTVKEYVQSSIFDKHYIIGSAVEQFVTLEIPSEFPKGWIEAGYSHIHVGAIRLALNYHGVEGKPVVARIALLDTRYLKYQDACIGTVEATMNNGLVMVTLFPNFTMALQDPNLMDALKVQIHIVGAQQVESSIIATLHYQIVYRVQDHAFWLGGYGSNDSLFITVNTQEQPHCVHIPRQIPKEEPIQLLLEKWITNYEQIHATRQPVRFTNNKIISKGDGTSEIRFDHSHLKDPQTPPIFPTQMMMIPRGDPTQEHDREDPDCWCELCHPGAESRIIEKFDADGKPILFFKDPITGPCPWNMDCSCEQCVEEDFLQEFEGGHHTSYKPHKKNGKKKKNSIHSQLYQRWKNGDPTVGPLGEDNGRFVFLVDYGPRRKEENSVPRPVPPDPLPPPVQPCYKKIQKWIKKNPEKQKDSPQTNLQSICMFTPVGPSYNKEFPPLEEFTEKEYMHIPKIPTQLHGDKVNTTEATLNWQTENALAQNATLQIIDAKVTQIDTKITMVETKVDSNTKIANELIVALHRMLKDVEKRTIEPGQDLLYYVEQKKQEIQRLKDHIKYLQEHGLPPSAQPEEAFFPSRSTPTSFSHFEIGEPLSPPKTEQSQQSSESDYSDDSQSTTSQTSSEDEICMEIPEVKTKDADPMDTDASPSTAAPPPIQINSGKHIFTLDDIPSTRWAQRLQEFQAWMDTQKLTRESNYEILAEFVSRFTGTLRDWWNSLSQPDQVAFLTRQSFPEIIQVLHTFFLGNQEDVKTLKRKEFFKRKCCSSERKDLQRHFTIMTKLFYFLGADINLLASIPEILQNAVSRHLQNRGRRIENLTIGEIQQETYMALEEICDRKKLVKDYLTGSKEIDKACKDNRLQIKCKETRDCHCRQKKRSQRRNNQHPFIPPAYPRSLRRKRKWRYLRKKQPQGLKSSKCYICGQIGHFAKRCPKNKQGAKMI